MPGIPAAPKSADVEVQVFHYGVGRAEEPAEERPHIGMEWHVEKGVRHIADSHEVVSGEEPTDLLEGSEGEPKACHICGRIEAGASPGWRWSRRRTYAAPPPRRTPAPHCCSGSTLASQRLGLVH